MKFKSLELQYYRKYKNVYLEFKDGITSIVGNNGVGKSTIFEAILVALNGPIASRGDKRALRSRICPDKETKMIFEFILNDDCYKIIRVIKGKNDTVGAELIKNDNQIAKNNSAVNKKIQEILGIDYKSQEVSIFAKQGEISALSSMEPGDRRSVIPRLIGIDIIDKIIKNIKNDKKELSIQLDVIRQSIDNPNEIKNVLSDKNNNIKLLEEELRNKKDSLKEKEKNIDSLRKIVDKNKEKKQKFGFIKKELINLNEIYQQSKEELSKLKDKSCKLKELKKQILEFNRDNLENELLKLENKLSKLENNKDILNKIHESNLKLVSIDDKISLLIDAKEKISELYKNDDLIDKIKISLDKIKKVKLNAEKIIMSSNSRVEILKENINKLSNSNKCPVCETELSKDSKILNELNKKMKVNLEKINNLKPKLNSINDKEKSLEKRLSIEEENKRLRDEYKKIILSNENLKNDILKIRNDIIETYNDLFNDKYFENEDDDIGKINKECSNILKKIEKEFKNQNDKKKIIEDSIKDINSKINEFNLLSNTIENLEDSLSGFKDLKNKIIEYKEKIINKNKELDSIDNINDCEKYEENLDNLEKEIKNDSDLLNDIMINIGVHKKEISLIKEKIEKNKENIKYRQEKESKIILLTRLIDSMDLFKMNLLSRIRPQLGKIGSDILDYTTGGKYQKMELDESYDIYIHSFGNKEKLNFYSGGEADLANLCVRITISKLIANNFKCLVLDEVFGFQDYERKSEIMSAFKNLLNNSFDQLFVITHDPFIKEKSDHVIQIEETEDGFNKVKYF